MQFHHVAHAPDLKATWEHLVHRYQLRLRRAEKIIGHARQRRVHKGLTHFVALYLRRHMPLMNGVRKQHASGNDG